MYPLNKPKIIPKDLSTDPRPVHLTVLPSDLPKTILRNRVIIKTKTPIPILFINSDSIYSLTQGCNLGTKTIVAIIETTHLSEERKLKENPWDKHFTTL